jgi:hypothetical protein
MEKTLMQINLKKLLSKAKLQKQLKKKTVVPVDWEGTDE